MSKIKGFFTMERLAGNIFWAVGIGFLIVNAAFLMENDGAETLAYAFVAISGGASYLLVRADLDKVNGGPMPWMWSPFIVTLMAFVVVLQGMHFDEAEGHNLAVTMLSHLGTMVEVLAKKRAGEPTDEDAA